MTRKTAGTGQTRCPVYIGYDRRRRHFKACRLRLQAGELVKHFRRAHGIEAADTLAFYADAAKDPNWWERDR